MGFFFSKSLYSNAEIKEYEEVTYLRRKEIKYLLKKFTEMANTELRKNREYRIPLTVLKEYPEFAANPFGDRICKIFSSTGDGSMDFEDFLNAMSTFSQRAPFDLKVEYLFQMFDYDNDGEIGDDDIKETIKRLVGPVRFDHMPVQEIIYALYTQTNLDNDEGISFTEFKTAATKNIDFHK